MCKNKRATFAAVKIEDNGTTETHWNASVKQKTGLIALIAAIVTILVGIIAVRAAVIEGVEGVSEKVFDSALEEFHEEAQPQILDEIDTRIEAHDVESELRAIERISEVQRDIAVVQQTVEHNRGQIDHQTELIEELLRKVDQ